MSKMIEFTDQEIVATRQMLDVALKTLGRSVVGAFAVIDQKLAAAQGNGEARPVMPVEALVEPDVRKNGKSAALRE